MKKLFALLFVTALLSVGVLAVPTAVEVVDNGGELLHSDMLLSDETEIVKSGEWGDNSSWMFTSDGLLFISGTGKIKSAGKSEGYPWFVFENEIKKVIFSDGITVIPKHAFGKYNCYSLLSEVELPDTLLEIEYWAFGYCKNLKKIQLPESIKTIGMCAFADNGLEWLIVPKGLEYFDRSACSAAVIFDGTEAEYEAASEKRYLPLLSDNRELFFIEDAYFTDSGCFIVQDGTLVKYLGSEEKISIPYGVEKLGDEVFYEHFNLTEVNIPNSVTDIGERVFALCENLKSITIPHSVKRIGADCFWKSGFYKDDSNWNREGILWNGNFLIEYDTSKDERDPRYGEAYGYVYIGPDVVIEDYALSRCRGLKNISVSPENELYCSQDGVLFNKDKSVLIQHPTAAYMDATDEEFYEYVIPSSVKTIGYSAFYFTRFDSIIIPESVERIEARAFECCYNLLELKLTESITHIGEEAFANSGILEIVIPDSVKEISSSLFCDVYGNGGDIERVKLPSEVSSIGNDIFRKCYNLTDVEMPLYAESIGKRVFENCENLKKIDIPQGIKEVDLSDSYLQTVTLPITINEVSLPDTISEIYYDGCKTRWEECVIVNMDLTDVTIHYNDSDKCSSVKDFVFSEEYDFDGDTGFVSGYAISEYTGTDSVVYIPEHVIVDGEIIKVITLGASAFSDNHYVKKVVLPESVVSIESYCFKKCTNLSSINLNNVEIIGTSAFFACNSLNNIEVSDSIKEIGAMAFNKTAYYNNEANWQDGSLYIDDCLVAINLKHKGKLLIKEGTRLVACNLVHSEITEIYVPSSLEIIGLASFAGDNVEYITVSEQNKYFANDENGILYDKRFETLISCPATKKSIQFSNNTTYISETAFWYSKMDMIKIPGKVEWDTNPFHSCEIENFVLLDGRKNTESDFVYTKTMKSVFLPSSITEINANTFLNCTSLSDVFFGGTEEQWNSIVIEERGNEALLNAKIHFGTIIDDNSNSFVICSDNDISKRAKFIISEINDDSVIEEIELYFNNYDLLVRNIKLMQDDDSEFDNVDDLRVFLEIPEECSDVKPMIFRQESDGTFTNLSAEIEDGFLVFSTDRMGIFIVAIPPYTPGELNSDGAVDMNDAILLLQHSMFPELYPLDYAGNVDFTGDGVVDMNDAILLLQHSMFPELYPIN